MVNNHILKIRKYNNLGIFIFYVNYNKKLKILNFYNFKIFLIKFTKQIKFKIPYL